MKPSVFLDKKGYSQSSNCSFGGCYKQEIYKKYAAGIKLFGGVSGDADKAVEAFINDLRLIIIRM